MFHGKISLSFKTYFFEKKPCKLKNMQYYLGNALSVNVFAAVAAAPSAPPWSWPPPPPPPFPPPPPPLLPPPAPLAECLLNWRNRCTRTGTPMGFLPSTKLP